MREPDAQPARSLAVRVAAVVGALALAGLLTAGCVPTRPGQAGGTDRARAVVDQRARVAADDFLRRYVRPDGRVARPDQGDDTVSEGQSYGLLLAEVADDHQTVDRIWGWTRDHLRRPDGLLSYHADAAGRVLDRASATDADLVVAWALMRAGGADGAALARDGALLGRAVLDHDTVRLPDGTLILAAGDWATGSPASLNPSYWAFPALDALGAAVPDPRWSELAAGAATVLDRLTAGSSRLPPDWARADGSSVRPTPAPAGNAPEVRYSFDAQRCLVWLAASAHPRPALASVMLRHGDDSATARALDLQGDLLDDARSPMAAVAAAAAVSAGGRVADRDRFLDEAGALDRTTPTYYGAAWVALGRVLLTTGLLGPAHGPLGATTAASSGPSAHGPA